MSKMEAKNLKIITPVEVAEKNNPLIKGITKVSENWHKRWSEIHHGQLKGLLIQT